MVEKHIKSLLYDHDCVIIPDFGGLITRYVSARIHPVKHALSPPSKKVAFNEKLTLNDGLLISTIAYRNNISKEEAQLKVSDFVHQAKAKLNEENKFVLQDIGIFKYTAERRLEFEYVEGDNFLEASFGLPELVIRPLKSEDPVALRTLLKERQQVPVNKKQPLRARLKRMYTVAAGLTICALSASAIYLLSVRSDYNLSSLNPIASIGVDYNKAPEKLEKRYTSDYVPLTADERLTAYDDILPAYELSNYSEEALPAETLPKSEESIALEEVVEQPIAKEVKTVEKVKEKAFVTETKTKEPVLTIKNKTGRFYIITGGYSTLENAEASRTAIRKIGHEAKVLLPGPGSKLYRVSAADYATWEEARSNLDKFRKSFGETLWVLNY